MNHKEVKELLLKNQEVKNQYDGLAIAYDIKREIIRLRLEQGLSQKALAERIGTKQSAISRLESGDYNPSIEFLDKIANALGKKFTSSFTNPTDSSLHL